MTNKAVNVGTPGHIDHGASAGVSELKAMLSTNHSCYGMVDGFAGETRDWDEDYVRVVFKIKKDDAMAIKDCALVKLQW
jgi:hypothetical protein